MASVSPPKVFSAPSTPGVSWCDGVCASSPRGGQEEVTRAIRGDGRRWGEEQRQHQAPFSGCVGGRGRWDHQWRGRDGNLGMETTGQWKEEGDESDCCFATCCSEEAT